VFRKEFCNDLIEELEHFEQSDAPKGRPNTMNNNGVQVCINIHLTSSHVVEIAIKMLADIVLCFMPDCQSSHNSNNNN